MIFVTGGTGLVGTHLLYELTSSEKKIKALKRETSDLQQVKKVFSYYTNNPDHLLNKIEWVNGDILDYYSLEKLFNGVSEIYHCAAVISFRSGERRKMILNNVTGTENVVNAALENGVKKICYVSSVAALGRLQNGRAVTEETNWVPSRKVTGYSESKFFSETEVWRGIEEGLDAVIVNPSIILGPGNWNTGSAKLFKSVWDGLSFYTKGVTGFVDVKDVVKAMVLLMEPSHFEKVKNQRFLLNAENTSYQNLFNQIAGALGRPNPKYFTPDWILEIAWRAASLGGWIIRRPTMITRDAVASSNRVNHFDGSKITRNLNFSYLPISESIQQTSKILKKEMIQGNN